MGATFGRNLRMTIFGESHGKGIGLVLDGLPPGTPVNEDFIKEEMARRAPGKNRMSTQRRETDAFIIESGVFEGKATGTPLCVLIPNSDQHSKDYSLLKDVMRPGHADYAGKVRYRGFNDYRGGGHFSGRLTAPLVFTGAVAKTRKRGSLWAPMLPASERLQMLCLIRWVKRQNVCRHCVKLRCPYWRTARLL